MPAISATPRQSGKRSATFTLPTSAGADTVANAQIIAACEPGGALHSLLSATYADAAAFSVAAAEAGLSTSVSPVGATATPSVFAWACGAGAAPTLAMTAGAIGVVIVKLSVSHSLTR